MFAQRTNWNLTANPLSEALAKHRRAAKPLLDLTVSNPTECGFQYESEAVLQALSDPATLSYHPDPKGLQGARRAIAGYYADHRSEILPEDIILTTGTSEAYSFVFRTLCNPGDEILIPAPSYPLFDFLADIQDVRLVPYPLLYDNGWQIDFHVLENALTPRTRGLITVHPNNPTGHFTKAGEIARLNELCSTHAIALIADEVFLDFTITADPPDTFAANQAVLTFTLSGLSKISGLPQMKVAWLITSGPTESKMQASMRLEVIADTYLSMNTPLQLATPTLLEQRRVFQLQSMDRIRQNLAELDRQLAEWKSCNRLVVEGGWYAVLRVPVTGPDEDLAIKLLQTQGVYLHPGHFYDFAADGYLVVSLITPQQEFAEGIRRTLGSF
jgi:alanine-synthesizing transaminase